MGAKGEEEKQEIQNLFEQVMKENFSNLANRIPGSPGSSVSQKTWIQEETHQGTS